MKARIELQDNIVLSGELSMISEFTITIRVNDIDTSMMQQLYTQKISVTKLTSNWSCCVCRDKIVGINIQEGEL